MAKRSKEGKGKKADDDPEKELTEEEKTGQEDCFERENPS